MQLPRQRACGAARTLLCDATWQSEMKCLFPGPTVTHFCSFLKTQFIYNDKNIGCKSNWDELCLQRKQNGNTPPDGDAAEEKIKWIRHCVDAENTVLLRVLRLASEKPGKPDLLPLVFGHGAGGCAVFRPTGRRSLVEGSP